MCSALGTRRAELKCSVLEEDWQRGQSYTAQWHCLTLVPQPHDRLTLTDAERSEKHREARRLLQRFLSGAISKSDPHPKTQSRRPHRPICGSAMLGPDLQQGPVCIQEEVCEVVSQKSAALESSQRKTVVKMSKLSRFLG